MVEMKKFSQIIEKACEQTVQDYMDSEHAIFISKIKSKIISEEISGPSIEVEGEKFHYSCLLEYQAKDNLKFLDLLTIKYPFIDEADLPEIDILDLLGEFLNILCGKINKELEQVDSTLNIEIPYFVYGLDTDESMKLSSLECKFGDLSFNLHYQI
jgi:hypothetical protein